MRLLSLTTLLAIVLPLTAQTPLHLIPTPREIKPASAISLANGLQINCADPCDPEDAFAIADLKSALAERNIPVATTAGTPHIFVVRYTKPIGKAIYLQTVPSSNKPDHSAAPVPPEFLPEGYAIIPDGSGPRDGGLALTANTSSGIFYGLQTIKQLIVGDGTAATLQTATIRDWPAMPYRGLSDDLSRGPVDTLDFQKKLVRTLAAYKANLYSPYFENTQQYASNPLPAPPAGAISAADARELVAYAAHFHVTIVPEQEAFGHLRHSLIWEQYQNVAETPHGAVLAPGQPDSLKIISQEFTELAALYPSPFLHVGGDETEDLGKGQTKSLVDSAGLGKVYLDFMSSIDTTLRPLNRRLLFWGDIAQDSPDLLKAMSPQFKHDTIAIGWQYNPSAKGFAKYLKPYADAGFETWVAPGINNWNRIYPNYNYGLANIQQFTRDGQAMGATGQLNTIWYDDGEALASNNWYGILFGAAAAWQKGESNIADFQNSYAQVFHGDLSGKLNDAQKELMAAHQLLKTSAYKGDGSDLLFWSDPWAKDQQQNAAKLRPILHELRLHAERALTLIAEVRAANPSTNPGAPSSPTASSSVRVGIGEADLSRANWFPSTSLREPDAIDALELGARRFDFLALKIQLADEIPQIYAIAQTQAASPDKKTHNETNITFSTINGVNGRIQDIKDTYALLRDMYAQLWLRTNRPYALRPVLEHYDYTVAIWLARMDKARSAIRQFDSTDILPPVTDLGVPPPQ